MGNETDKATSLWLYKEAGIHPAERENVSHGPEDVGRDTWVTFREKRRKLPRLNHAAPNLPHSDSLTRCQINSRLAEGQLENK